MFNRSIAYRLSIFISVAVVAVFMVFIVIIFIYNQRVVRESIDNEANSISLETVSLVHRQLISTQESAKNLADQILYYAENENSYLVLNSILERYTFLNAIYVSVDSLIEFNRNLILSRNADSVEFIRANELSFQCEKEKEVLNNLKTNDFSKWSEAYRCDTNSVLTISYYTPILKSSATDVSKKIGSVICELSLKYLNDTINNMKIGQGGYAFLVNEKGTFLTHPDKKWIFSRNLFSLPQKSYDDANLNVAMIFKNKLTGSIIGYPEHLDYKKSWIHYTPVSETGWYLLVVFPYDELFFPLYILILRMLFISVVGILVIFFIVTYITNKQIQPLSTVTTQLKKFSTLSGKSELNTLNEVKIVSESLDSIRAWFESYRLSQYQEEKLSKQRKQDLQEASEIQMSLINTDFTGFSEHKEIDLYAVYKPARIVSGDLFDFFFIDDDNLVFSIGDVSGKGISAAFFMSVAQTIIKGNAKLRDPEKIVFQANNELTTANQHQFFLTLFLGVFNFKSGILCYCNAAHTATEVVKPNGEIIELNQSHGLPLGIYANKHYANAAISLEKGDTIWLYTDGVTDLLNEHNVQFGKTKMDQELKLISLNKPKEIIEHMEISLEQYRGKSSLTDDITMMAINYRK